MGTQPPSQLLRDLAGIGLCSGALHTGLIHKHFTAGLVLILQL